MNNYKKEQINIDTVCKYSTDDIFNALKNYINYEEKIYNDDGDEISLYHRLTIVCGFTRYLIDEKSLNHTIDFLRKFDLINDIQNTGIDLSSYSEIDVTKIKAIYYSLTSFYKLNIKALKFPNSKNPKQLNIKLKENRVIEHNLQETLNSIQMNNVYQFEESISKDPINAQKNEINKWIRSALKVNSSKETKMFDVEIDYLKDISNHLIEPETSQLKPSIDKREGVPVIALLYYYNGQFIARDNAQSIAKEYGYNSKNSGEGLYHDFMFYADNTNRKASGETKVKCKNRIKFQKRVVELLIDETAKAKAMTELNILESKLIELS
nr:hypothetical protein [uncultured Flavobacterium sp.]